MGDGRGDSQHSGVAGHVNSSHPLARRGRRHPVERFAFLLWACSSASPGARSRTRAAEPVAPPPPAPVPGSIFDFGDTLATAPPAASTGPAFAAPASVPAPAVGRDVSIAPGVIVQRFAEKSGALLESRVVRDVTVSLKRRQADGKSGPGGDVVPLDGVDPHAAGGAVRVPRRGGRGTRRRGSASGSSSSGTAARDRRRRAAGRAERGVLPAVGRGLGPVRRRGSPRATAVEAAGRGRAGGGAGGGRCSTSSRMTRPPTTAGPAEAAGGRGRADDGEVGPIRAAGRARRPRRRNRRSRPRRRQTSRGCTT